MFSKPVAVGVLLVVACITGVAGGAYLANRHSAETAVAATPAPATVPPATQETEAVVTPSGTAGTAAATPVDKPAPVVLETERPRLTSSPAAAKPRRPEPTPAARPASSTAVRTPTPAIPDHPAPAPAPAASSTVSEPSPARSEPAATTEPAPVDPPRLDTPPAREFVDLEVAAASVIGLRIETPVTTETARVEDRVEARVMRDVAVDSRTAIAAGTRALGAVTMVERGGKVKERARLGVRFHTLVLADGTQLPIRTDTIIREGESPAGDSARKIGGAAVGGAILGALMGGKKGAIVGGTAGAAGGTAVVMAGDREAATLPSGSVVTVRLSAPVQVEVEKK
jgi:hypothetical protein